MSDKTVYPTFARTKPEDLQISKAVVSMLLHMNWKKIVFVYGRHKHLLADTILTVIADDVMCSDIPLISSAYILYYIVT